jgi:methionyl-tRNA formyltransferase
MRIVYFTYWGTIGDQVLEWMVNNTDEEILAVVSRPGEPGESIKDIAFKYYLPLYQPPENVNDPAFIEVLRGLEPDLFISMYFGRLFSPELLQVPKKGCINMHPTLLPKGRGQGPSTWPIVYGDKETGQTIHYLDEGIDSGDIIAQRAIPIEPDDTSATLGAKLADLGVQLFIETWPLIASGQAPRIPQDDSQATYTVAARREHARIDWSQSGIDIHNLCRAFTAGKGAWSRVGGKRLYVWKAEPYTGDVEFEPGVPGQVLGVVGRGVAVQAGDGPIVLTGTQVTQEGPDLLSYLRGTIGAVPVVLGS